MHQPPSSSPYTFIYELLVSTLNVLSHQGRITWLTNANLTSLLRYLTPDQPTTDYVTQILNIAHQQNVLRELLLSLRDSYSGHIDILTEIDSFLEIDNLANLLFPEKRNSSRYIHKDPRQSDSDLAIESIVKTLVGQFAQQTGLSESFSIRSTPNFDTPPIIPQLNAPRESLIPSLQNILREVTWLAIHGGTGEGKTQIARTIFATRNETQRYWVSFRNKSTIARHHLYEQIGLWLSRLRNIPYNQLSQDNTVDLIRGIIDTLGDSGLLVLDDLPDNSQDIEFFQDLAFIVAECSKSNISILSTSQRPLPPQITTEIGSSVRNFKAPLFDKDEVEFLLKNAGIPIAIINNSLVPLILSVTKGHPWLILATIRWAQTQIATKSTIDLGALLQGNPVEDVKEYIRRKLVHDLAIEERDLLYRLSLLESDFDRDLINILAEVPSKIVRALEFFDNLIGPWIDRLQGGRYTVSPLIAGVGTYTLSPVLQHQLHKSIARYYLANGAIDSAQMLPVAVHLWKAKDYPTYVVYLIQLLLAVETKEQAEYIQWATFVFSPTEEWPSNVTLHMRLLLRSFQIRVRDKARKDFASLYNDLSELLAQITHKLSSNNASPIEEADIESTLELLALFSTHMSIGLLRNIAPRKVFRHFIQARRLLSQVTQISNKHFPNQGQTFFTLPFEETMWIFTLEVRTAQDIEDLLTEIGSLTATERQTLLAGQMVAEFLSSFVDRIWMLEGEHSKDEQNWNSVLAQLNRVKTIAMLEGGTALLVHEVRARAIVLAEKLGNLDSALDLLFAQGTPQDSHTAFILHYTIGVLLSDSQRFEESTGALLQVSNMMSELASDFLTYYQFDALRRLAVSQNRIGQTNEGNKNCRRAIHYGHTHIEISEFEAIELLGELAGGLWTLGHRAKACGALYGLVMGLVNRMATTDSKPLARELYNKTNYALKWYLQSLSGIPVEDSDKIEPVVAGHFGIRRPHLSTYVLPFGFNIKVLLRDLILLTYRLGLKTLAWNFYKVASTTPGEFYIDYVMLSGQEAFALMRSNAHPSDIFLYGLNAVKPLAILQNHKLEQSSIDNQINSPTNMNEVWENLSPSNRTSIERQLLYTLVIPMFFDLLTTNPEMDRAQIVLSDLAAGITKYQHRIVDIEFWIKVIEALRTLAFAYIQRERLPDILPEVVAKDRTFWIVWYLLAGLTPGKQILNNLRLQVQMINLVSDDESLRQAILPNIASLLNQFWTHISNTRAFTLRQPSYFRERIESVRDDSANLQVAKVLQAAADTLSTSLPSEFIQKLASYSTE